MTSSSGAVTGFNRYTAPVIGAIGVLVFTALTFWAGFPEEKFAAFVSGAALLIGGMAAYGVLAWHLMERPLPAGVEALPLAMQPVAQRRLLAVLVTLGGMGIVIGGFWDEVWHRSFGFPFGPDLFWRPHILIYFGLLTPPLLAAWGLYVLFKKGHGSLQQRFRADPVSGALALAGGFLLYTVPADPIWHLIYGEDISAWSLPHIMLLFSVTMIMLLAAFIQLTTLPERSWLAIWRARLPELLVAVALAFALQIQLQVLATDWENGNEMLTRRPDWLLPCIFAGLAGLMGVLGNRSLRRYGAATLLGLIALTVRFSLITAFDYQAIAITTWLPILPPLVTLDLWYAYRFYKKREAATEASAHQYLPILDGLAVTAGLLGSLWIIDRIFDYPSIVWPGVFWMILAGLVVSAVAAWIGGLIGDGLASGNKQVEEVVRSSAGMRWAPLALFSVVVLFIVFFVATASPPR